MVEQVLEVVKQYELTIEGYGIPVFAKIVKEKDAEKYGWSISHYYQPEDGGEVYKPSKADVTGYETIEDAKRHLFLYADKFTAKKRIEINPLFRK